MPWTPLELVAVVFTLVCVWLAVKQNMWTWPLGVIAVTLYGTLFYREKLYADMGLQAIYFALNVYGWYEWLYGGKGHTKLKVSRVPGRLFAVLFVFFGFLAWGVAWLLGTHTDAAAPYLDSTLTSYSIFAQILMTRKWIENWHLWITVDVAYVYLFISRDLYLTAGLYAVFIVMASIGLIEWRQSMRADSLEAMPEPATE